MTVPFISAADLSKYLGRDVTAEDMTTIALDAACDKVRDALDNRLNWAEDDPLTLHGSGTSALELPNRPVHSVSDVTEDGVAVASDGYVLSRAGVLYRLNGFWTLGSMNITLKYSHGYAPSEDLVGVGGAPPERMPSSIRSVALASAKRIFGAGTSAAAGGIVKQTLSRYSYQVDPGAVALAAGDLSDEELASIAGHASVGVP